LSIKVQRYIISISIIFLIFTSCTTNRAEETRRTIEIYNQQQREARLVQQTQREEARLALETKLETYRGIVRETIERARDVGSPILIFNYYTRLPNSAGGVSCIFEFMNVSDKRIKYVYFTVVPYNAVDDIVTCTISRASSVTLEQTGYIAPFANNYEKFPSSFAGWENVWYNYNIRYMKINRIEVVFEDNSRKTLSGNDINSSILQPDIATDRDFKIIIDDGR